MDAKEKIDRLRFERGWSLYRLAKELNISNTTAYSWYNETIAFRLNEAELYSDIDGNDTNAKEVVLIEFFRALRYAAGTDDRDYEIFVKESDPRQT